MITASSGIPEHYQKSLLLVCWRDLNVKTSVDCYSNENWIGKFFAEIAEPAKCKCTKAASKFREAGNDCFRKKKFGEALHLYNEVGLCYTVYIFTCIIELYI